MWVCKKSSNVSLQEKQHQQRACVRVSSVGAQGMFYSGRLTGSHRMCPRKSWGVCFSHEDCSHTLVLATKTAVIHNQTKLCVRVECPTNVMTAVDNVRMFNLSESLLCPARCRYPARLAQIVDISTSALIETWPRHNTERNKFLNVSYQIVQTRPFALELAMQQCVAVVFKTAVAQR